MMRIAVRRESELSSYSIKDLSHPRFLSKECAPGSSEDSLSLLRRLEKTETPDSPWYFKKYLEEYPEFSEKWLGKMAKYLGIPPETVILRMQQSWGIMSICKGVLPEKEMKSNRSKAENRLQAALMLIFWAERLYGNLPEQIKDLITQIVKLEDNTEITISKHDGRIKLNKKKLQATS